MTEKKIIQHTKVIQRFGKPNKLPLKSRQLASAGTAPHVQAKKRMWGSKDDLQGSKAIANNERELLYYGQHICLALSKKRRTDIVRVYCTEEKLKLLGELLRWCAKNRKAYHVVTEGELERITGSVHHEGLAILAKCEAPGSTHELLKLVEHQELPLVLIDGVQNPHNIGTIMRVMANFGWPFLVGALDLPLLTAAAARMSEGGAECVRMFACDDMKRLCLHLKLLGYRIYGTSSHAHNSLYSEPFLGKSVIVLGSESEGMSSLAESLVDEKIVIPGTNQVESLNVAVACGLLLGEYTRLHGLISTKVPFSP